MVIQLVSAKWKKKKEACDYLVFEMLVILSIFYACELQLLLSYPKNTSWHQMKLGAKTK